MQKLLLSLIVVLIISFKINAQTMKCGTELFINKFKNDTANQRKLQEQEKQMSEWIRNNPNSRMKNIKQDNNSSPIQKPNQGRDLKTDSTNHQNNNDKTIEEKRAKAKKEREEKLNNNKK